MHYRERRCPYCGRTNGLHTTDGFDYDFQGNCRDDSERISPRKNARMYCDVCGKRVCSIKDYKKLYPKED